MESLVSIKDFESLSIIGRGAFGEVRVCKEKSSGEIVAIKKMRKEDMFQKNQVLHVRTEREIMITSNNPWVVSLKYSFQDDFHLFLVMDFLPGGDLIRQPKRQTPGRKPRGFLHTKCQTDFKRLGARRRE
ncbi:MAG: protein kinase domain-containing protein, partial [Flammeovirgaceae bacterium]